MQAGKLHFSAGASFSIKADIIGLMELADELIVRALSQSGGMADAVDSKSTGGNIVRVRLPPLVLRTYN